MTLPRSIYMRTFPTIGMAPRTPPSSAAQKAKDSSSTPRIFEGRLPLLSEAMFNEDYEIGEELGKGNFSVVYEVKNRKTGQSFACKVIDKRRLNENEKSMLQNEIDILQRLSDPNIVSLFRIYDTEKRLYLVMEHLRGGELFSRIVNVYPDGYSEHDAANVFAKILEGVCYLHSMNIVHRDLKPENLLYLHDATLSQIKISDFGLSKTLTGPSQRLYDAVGTPQYVAPEVVTGDGHGLKADMWSLGVVLYVLLCGGSPFYADSDDELFAQIIAGDYSLPDEYFGHISEDAKMLLRALLTVDQNLRWSAREALESPWINHRQINSTARIPNITDNLKSFIARRRFRIARHKLVAAQRFLNLPGMPRKSLTPTNPKKF